MTQNRTDTDVLSSRQIKAIEALLACDTVTKACEVAEITRATMYTYLKDTEFNKAECVKQNETRFIAN